MGGHNNHNKGQSQSRHWGEYFVADTGKLYRYPVYKRTIQRMETKLLIWVANVIGVPALISQVLANIHWDILNVNWTVFFDNWKSGALTILGSIWLAVRIVFFCIKQWDMHLLRRKKLREGE